MNIMPRPNAAARARARDGRTDETDARPRCWDDARNRRAAVDAVSPSPVLVMMSSFVNFDGCNFPSARALSRDTQNGTGDGGGNPSALLVRALLVTLLLVIGVVETTRRGVLCLCVQFASTRWFCSVRFFVCVCVWTVHYVSFLFIAALFTRSAELQ